MKNKMVRIIALASLISSILFAASGQLARVPSAFEVASVRSSKPGIRGSSLDFLKGGERLTATNMPFGALVLIAFNITVRQLSGPDAFFSEKYDIEAKPEHPVGTAEMLHMLQTLLEDRFKLVIRHETKDVPVYALTIGKDVPKLHESNPLESEDAGPRTPARAGGTELRSGQLIFKNESMSDFAWALSRMAGIGDRVVVDETGLKGNYDFELTFRRDLGTQPGPGVHKPVTPSEDPSIFSALREQLGLKLESKKTPVEFLIIDHVEEPSEN